MTYKMFKNIWRSQSENHVNQPSKLSKESVTTRCSRYNFFADKGWKNYRHRKLERIKKWLNVTDVFCKESVSLYIFKANINVVI
jgi:hypothetical protein